MISVTVSHLFPTYTDIQIIHSIQPSTANRGVQALEFCVGFLTTCTSTLGRAHLMWLSLKERSASIRRTSNPSGSRASMGLMPTSSAQLSGIPRWERSHRWLFLETCDPSGAALPRLHQFILLTRRFRDVLQTEYPKSGCQRATPFSYGSMSRRGRVPLALQIVKQSAAADAYTSARHSDLRNVHEDSPSRTFSVSGISDPDVRNYSRYAFQRCRVDVTFQADGKHQHMRRSPRCFNGLLDRSQHGNH